MLSRIKEFTVLGFQMAPCGLRLCGRELFLTRGSDLLSGQSPYTRRQTVHFDPGAYQYLPGRLLRGAHGLPWAGPRLLILGT
jgi:hypothetical protein